MVGQPVSCDCGGTCGRASFSRMTSVRRNSTSSFNSSIRSSCSLICFLCSSISMMEQGAAVAVSAAAGRSGVAVSASAVVAGVGSAAAEAALAVARAVSVASAPAPSTVTSLKYSSYT